MCSARKKTSGGPFDSPDGNRVNYLMLARVIGRRTYNSGWRPLAYYRNNVNGAITLSSSQTKALAVRDTDPPYVDLSVDEY